MFGFNMNPN